MPDRSAPLSGVRVLDFTHVVAGPYCTMMLADMGAEVVKIERPGSGDDLRSVARYPGRGPDDQDYFYSLNRRKRSVVLNLKEASGRSLAQELAAQADVVVQNLSPGIAEKLGIGADVLRARNPRLIYCSISAFGQTGPLRDYPGTDTIVQAYSGLMSVTGEPDGPPMITGAPLVDVIGGMSAAFAIVSALHEVKKTGSGVVLDLGMLDCILAAMGPRMSEALQARHQPGRVGNGHSLRFPVGTYETANGSYINIMVSSQAHWPHFCEAVERKEWIDDPRFATMQLRLANRAALNRLVQQRMKELTAEEWFERFRTADIPVAPVLNYVQAVDNPQIVGRGMILEVEHKRSGRLKLMGPPWGSAFKRPPLTPPPLLGESTGDVLQEWLGWKPADAEAYAQSADPTSRPGAH